MSGSLGWIVHRLVWTSHELLQAKELDTVNAQPIFGAVNCCEAMLAIAAFYVIPNTQHGPRHTGWEMLGG